MYNDEEEVSEFLKYLQDTGVLEWVGMDLNTSEPMFKFNFDIMREIMPEFYNALMEEINIELLELYKIGFVEIEYDEQLQPKFKLTEAGKQYVIENGIPFPEELE